MIIHHDERTPSSEDTKPTASTISHFHSGQDDQIPTLGQAVLSPRGRVALVDASIPQTALLTLMTPLKHLPSVFIFLPQLSEGHYCHVIAFSRCTAIS